MDVITFPENLLNASGLSILLHGLISLPDTTSYDNKYIFGDDLIKISYFCTFSVVMHTYAKNYFTNVYFTSLCRPST